LKAIAAPGAAFVNGIDDSFEHSQLPRRQADTRSNDDTIIFRRSELMLNCRPSAFIGPDEEDVGLPSARSELFQRNRNTGADLSVVIQGGKAGRKNPQSPDRSRPAEFAS